MMRIVYLTQSYPPMISGAAMVVEKLANGMAGSGHKVLVIAASDTSQTYVVEDGNLTVLRLKSVHNPQRVGQRFTPYSRRSVTDALQEFKPEAIHSHEPLPISLPAIRYAGEMNIPTVITIQQLPPTATRHFRFRPDRDGEAALELWALVFQKIHRPHYAHRNHIHRGRKNTGETRIHH